MPFLLEKEPSGVLPTPPENLQRTQNLYSMKKQKVTRMSVSLYLEFEAIKLVKVKAHKRIRNGKVEKVRSYYRRVWGR